MPYLYRRLNPTGKPSPFWYAGFDYRDASGKPRRWQKSTKCSDKKDAMRVARELEDAARKGAQGKLNREYIRAQFEELCEAITGEAPRRYTVKGWLDEFLANKMPTLAAGTHVRYLQVVRDFLASIGKKAEGDIERLNERDVMAFRDANRASGKSASTVNLEIKLIRSMLERACKRGVIAKNPASDVEPLPVGDTMREPFTLEEVQQVVKAAPDDEWRSLVLLGFYTGQRLGDLSRFRWANVDLEKRTYSLVPDKTRRHNARGLVLPLHPALHEHLLSLPSCDNPAEFIMPKLAGSIVGGIKGLSRGFIAIMRRAGVDTQPHGVTKGKGRRMATRSFHSLRHTFISMQANAGVSSELRMKLTGHSTEGVHARYTHHDMTPMRKALETIPSIHAA